MNSTQLGLFSRQISLCVFSVTLVTTAASPAGAAVPAGTGAGPGSSNAAPKDEPVELSPFVVRESGETGWVATETLAGSRLRTDLRDVPNQIETLTKEFMQDLDVTNLDDALIYTANTENKTEFASTSTAGDATNFPAEIGRVRGLNTPTKSRNFFETASPTDNYNLDRLSVASGPNAILFGLGSPAGILDSTPARALMRNRYGFTLRYDSLDSKRGTFDANVMIVPQKLAVRLMGVSQTNYTEKKPNFDRSDRLYGTITFKPFQHTALTVQTERSSRTWDRAPRTAPGDLVTLWLTADKIPGSGYTTAKPLFDNSNTANFNTIASNLVFARQTANPVMVQGEAGLRNWNNSVVVKSPSTMPGVDPTFDAGKRFTLTDPSIFPFDVSLPGRARGNDLGGTWKDIILEQRIVDNLFLELAYNHDKSTNHILTAGGQQVGDDHALEVDANRFIPGTTTPNPHVGQFYYQGNVRNRMMLFHREDWRASLSYEIDVARKFGEQGGWRKWLGRHRLMGLYSQADVENRDQGNMGRYILDDPVITGVALRAKTFQNWATNASRVPVYRHYFANPYEPTNAFGPFRGDWTLTDANGQPYKLYAFDTPLRAADGKMLGAASSPGGNKNKTNARIFVWQGFFLPDRDHRDRLVLTYGTRKDIARSATLDAASVTQDFSGLYPTLWAAQFDKFGPAQSGRNSNLGVVARPVRWLSLFYNKSTTFDVNVGRYGAFGNELPGAGGDGRDFGIRVDLWHNKLALKLNKYETTLGPARATNEVNDALKTPMLNIENRVLELDPSTPRINVTDGNRHGFGTFPSGQYNVISDQTGKGYELELNFSPSPSWNIRLNGAKAQAKETNIGQDWFQWLDLRVPFWQAVVAKNGEVDSAGRPVTWNTAPLSVNPTTGEPSAQTLAQYYQSVLVGQKIAFVRAVDGRDNPVVHGYRANAIVNYRFIEGRLKGFNVGGAFRYREAPVIGYGARTNSDGARLLDLDTAYKGEADRFVDFMAGYRGRLKAFGGVTYRLQLNIRNLLNRNDPIPIAALTTGAVYRVATVDSRLTSITFGVDF